MYSFTWVGWGTCHAGIGIVGLGSLLLPCAFQGLNSGCQAWQQVPLPIEPLCWPVPNFCYMDSGNQTHICGSTLLTESSAPLFSLIFKTAGCICPIVGLSIMGKEIGHRW